MCYYQLSVGYILYAVANLRVLVLTLQLDQDKLGLLEYDIFNNKNNFKKNMDTNIPNFIFQDYNMEKMRPILVWAQFELDLIPLDYRNETHYQPKRNNESVKVNCPRWQLVLIKTRRNDHNERFWQIQPKIMRSPPIQVKIWIEIGFFHQIGSSRILEEETLYCWVFKVNPHR